MGNLGFGPAESWRWAPLSRIMRQQSPSSHTFKWIWGGRFCGVGLCWSWLDCREPDVFIYLLTSHSMVPCWKLEISRDGSIYVMEIGEGCKSEGFCSFSNILPRNCFLFIYFFFHNTPRFLRMAGTNTQHEWLKFGRLSFAYCFRSFSSSWQGRCGKVAYVMADRKLSRAAASGRN